MCNMCYLQLLLEKQRLQGRERVVDAVSLFADRTFESCSEQLSTVGPNRDRDGSLTEATLLEMIDSSAKVSLCGMESVTSRCQSSICAPGFA